MNRAQWRTPDELARWAGAGTCGECGHVHGATCPAPVTEMPPGLVDPDGELTRLGLVVEDAVNYLVMRGWLEPEGDELPNWVLAELASLAMAGPCGSPACRVTSDGLVYPSDAADHLRDRWTEEWERAVPTWTCACGREYKAMAAPPGLAFWEPGEGGQLGKEAGHVELDAAGQRVKSSSACPRPCGRKFAVTIADQLNPQGALFY